MEYQISLAEIKRRIKAYTTLSVSIVFGAVFASIFLQFPRSLNGLIIILAGILLTRVFSFRFFRHLSQTKIILSGQSLSKIVNGVSEEYSLHHIDHIKIKWTKNHTIREIYIWLNNGESVFFTALEKFETFNQNLQNSLKKDVVVQNIYEPIDYDHPLFYSLLGLPISFLGLFLFKTLLSLSYSQLLIVIRLLTIYLFSIGLYFIFTRPISKRSGKNTVISDYLLGLFMIGSGIIFLFLFK